MNSITTYEETIDCEMQPKQSTIEFLQTFARIVYAKKLDCGITFSMVLN
ncbi:MAG: hypothetical protein LBN27_07895 [Prevotellaceae bacterium]|jgi:hypothetical protein|nr:hypothetical protein [Prevotellaceae bacterium]